MHHLIQAIKEQDWQPIKDHCLQEAVKYHDVSAAEDLIALGANPNSTVPIEGEETWNMLFYAIACGSLRMTNVLLEGGANPLSKSSASSLTPLEAAKIKNNPEIIDLLNLYTHPKLQETLHEIGYYTFRKQGD